MDEIIDEIVVVMYCDSLITLDRDEVRRRLEKDAGIPTIEQVHEDMTGECESPGFKTFQASFPSLCEYLDSWF